MQLDGCYDNKTLPRIKFSRLNIIMEGKNFNGTLYDSEGILNVKHGTEIQFINQYDTL